MVLDTPQIFVPLGVLSILAILTGRRALGDLKAKRL
jgi:hypothetical protein